MSREKFVPAIDIEPSELVREQHLKRLSGMIEIGGQLGFAAQRSPRGNYVYPTISFNDTFERARQLQTIYGGTCVRQSQKSWMWRVVGKKAEDLAEDMSRWTPARKNIIDAFQTCIYENSSFEENVELSKGFRNTQTRVDVKPEKYRDLVKDPYFVAGVIDARGVITIEEKWDTRSQESFGRNFIQVDVSSVNQGLLLALKNAYNGHIKRRNVEGQERTFKGQVVQMRRDSYRWTVKWLDAQRLVNSVRGYTLLREETIASIPDNFHT